MSSTLNDVFFPTVSSTILQLQRFLVAQVERLKPDAVIVIERKGTAVYRAVLELASGELPAWRSVVSSSSISAIPSSFFYGKRILVFDDMLRQGNQVRSVLKELRGREVTDDTLSNVHVAAFATHEEAGGGYRFGSSLYPHAVYHRNLSDDAYRSVRSQIVTALQESGSLMLDTEHIELRVEQRAPLSALARALSRGGTVVAFQSGSARTNLTVFYDDSTVSPTEWRLFPPGVGLHRVVRKCRLVERAPGEFALIPISLPDVPAAWLDWRPAEEDAPLLDPRVTAQLDLEGQFYAVALRASLEPLALAVRDLVAAGPTVAEFGLPLPPGATSSARGYDLSHLHVVYPTLDIEALHARLLSRYSDAEANGRRLRRKRWPGGQYFAPSRESLRDAAVALLQRIALACDTRAAEHQSGGVAAATRGVRLAEVVGYGSTVGLLPHYVSACMDLLIDEALLITRVERLQVGEQIFGVRTYLPDGEVASEQIRDFTRRYGLIRASELP